MRTAAVIVLAIVMAAMIVVAGCTKANATVAPMNAPEDENSYHLVHSEDGKQCFKQFDTNKTLVKCTPTQENLARIA